MKSDLRHFSLFSLAAWAIRIVASASIPAKEESPLQVTLSPIGDSNSRVQASVTNTADRGYNLYYKGSFLDSSSPVDKFVVSGPTKRAPFYGVLLHMATHGELAATNFVPIEAQQTIETEIDIAELYDVETTASYIVRAVGAMPYADLNSTTLTGDFVSYTSNALTLEIDGDMAKATPYAVEPYNITLSKRTRLNNGCSNAHMSQLKTALKNCVTLSENAAEAALNGNANKFQEFFKTTAQVNRQQVAKRFRAVAQDCSSQNGGSTKTLCSDQYNLCERGVIAYTLPQYNVIAYCGIFYNQLKPVTTTCHGQDQATTVVHEETHARGVMSPSTEDYAYGYNSQKKLNANKAFMNADSYAMYASAVWHGC